MLKHVIFAGAIALALIGCATTRQVADVEGDLTAAKIRLVKVEEQLDSSTAAQKADFEMAMRAERLEGQRLAHLSDAVRGVTASEAALAGEIGGGARGAQNAPQALSVAETLATLSQRIASIEEAQAEMATRVATTKRVSRPETLRTADAIKDVAGLRDAFGRLQFDVVVAAAPRLLMTPETGPQDEKRFLYGESLYRLSRKTDAYNAYSRLRARSPASAFAGKALLRIGEINLASGNRTSARSTFNAVVREYNGTPEAVIARDQLAAMIRPIGAAH